MRRDFFRRSRRNLRWRSTSGTRQRKGFLDSRPLRCERLEDRRLLDAAIGQEALDLLSESSLSAVESQGPWGDEGLGNDTPGVTVTESGGSTDIGESGALDAYAIALDTAPTSPVGIRVTAELGQTEVSLDGESFFSIFNVMLDSTEPRMIIVRAVDDALSEGHHSSTISHAIFFSSDSDYPTTMPVAGVTVHVRDNDLPGVSIIESSGSTIISESGLTDTYTVGLDKAPTSTVQITVTADAQSQVSVDGTTFGASVSFLRADTSLQIVTVRAVDDLVAEGVHTSLITHAITSSSDPSYPMTMPLSSIVASVADNEGSGVTVTESGGSTAIGEDGSTDTYTIALDEVPAGTIALTVSAGPQSQVSLDGVTFDSSVTIAPVDTTPETITVRAIDDLVEEGPHTSVIAHAITASTAVNYPTTVPIAAVVAEITDNDTAKVVVIETNGSTLISEGGVTDTYTIALADAPSGSVALNATADAQSEVSLDGLSFSSSVSFVRTSTAPQIITVRARDDSVVEGLHTSVINHSIVFSNDPDYPFGLPIASVVAQVTDNEGAGVTVTETGGSTSISEAGTMDIYTIALNSVPLGDVTITVTADPQSQVSTNGSTFNSSVSFTRTSTSPQTITVRAVDDLVPEGTHVSTLSQAITASNDPNYPTTMPIASVVATVTDNEGVGITVAETGGSTNIGEAGGMDTYSIALNVAPSGPVTMSVTADAQSEVSVNGVVFGSSASFVRSDTIPQTITVRAINDLVIEGPHTSTITHAITSSSDPNYPTSMPIASVVANVADNESIGVMVTETGGSTQVSEAGATDAYAIALTAAPTGTVVVTVVADAQSLVSADGINFSTLTNIVLTNRTPQTVVVRAIDDAVAEGLHSSLLTHAITSSSDPSYPTSMPIASVLASVLDNEPGTVVVAQTGLSTVIGEAGATDTYTIALGTPPTGPIVISVAADSQSEVSLDGMTFSSSLTFTRTDTFAQTITVRAVDDQVVEGTHTSTISHAIVASSDPNYPTTLSLADIVASVADDDVAGVTVTETNGGTDISEAGETDTYSIALNAIPTGSVFITATADAQSRISLDGTNFGSSVTFVRTNTAPQTVMLRAIDDLVVEGIHNSVVRHAITSSTDPNYPTTLPIVSIVAQVTDNDVPGVTVVESEGTTEISEAGVTDTFAMALNTLPTGPVVISVHADEQSEVSLDGIAFSSSLTFTRNDTTVQTITVRAINDLVAEGTHTSTIINAVLSSADLNYGRGTPVADVIATVTDNDVAAVIVTETGGSTDISEAGVADTYTIALATPPVSSVTVNVTADAQSEVSIDGVTFNSSVSFTQNDSTPRTITVRAIDDGIAEGLHASTLTNSIISSSDPAYPTSLALASVVANITDNDAAGMIVVESDGSTDLSEAGGTDSYTIALATAPAGVVAITVIADAQSEISLDGTTFGAATSFVRTDTTPQTISVRAVDDHVREGPHASVITHAITSSSDPAYPVTMPVPRVVANVTDNDVAGITITESGGRTDVSESGVTDTYTISLDAVPSGPVVIAVMAFPQIEVSLDGVNFNSIVNYVVSDVAPQTILVRAVDDNLVEGPHTSLITHAIAFSSDPEYSTSLPIADVAVNIADNDVSGVTITETDGSTNISESGVSDTYTIRLEKAPVDTVVITISADGQSEVSLDGVTFSPTIDYTPTDTAAQTVTVRAIDDSVPEGPHASIISHAITASSDPSYPLSMQIEPVVALIADNEAGGVVITESDGSTDISEDGATDTYTITLIEPPVGTMVITVTADAQSKVSLDGTNFRSSLTLSPTDTTPRTITVRAVDDRVDEGVHTSTITHAITSSTAPNYPTTLPLADVVADVIDNDVSEVQVIESGGSTDISEMGGVDTYTIGLLTQPAGSVVISVNADAQSQVSLDGTTFRSNVSVVRTSTTPITIHVRAVDDQAAEGPHTSLISQAIIFSGDSDFPVGPITPVVAHVTDDEVAGVTVAETGGSTDIGEGGALDQYTIQLNEMPTGSVVITVTADSQSEVSVDGVTFGPIVSFARTNTAPQTVTVRAVDDQVIEGIHTSTISQTITSSSAANFPLTLSLDDIIATITDNDVAGVTVVESDGSTDVEEAGATDTYTIALDTAPSGPVEVTVTADAQSEVSLDGMAFGTSVSFARTNTAAQTVTVRAVDDQDIEGPHTSTITQAITSSVDADYPTTLALADVVANVTDNDNIGVTITESDGSTDLAEDGATDTYMIALDTVPAGTVEIAVTADPQSEVSLDGVDFAPSVTFARTDMTAQTITVRAIDDPVAEATHTSTISHAITSSADPSYPTTLAIADVVANVADNDVAGVTVTESDASTDLVEAGATDTLTIALDTPPTGAVEITVTADPQSELSLDGITFGSVVSFDRSDTAAQTITVRAVDDQIIEGTHTSTITAAITASADPHYPTSLPIAGVVASITDNDVAGVTVTESDGSTELSEAGATDSYTIALDAQPTWLVEITVSADAQTEVSLDGTTFGNMATFTPTDTTPQTVTVRALDDAVFEGAHTSTITQAITASADPGYPPTLAIDPVVANIADNDSPPAGDLNGDGQVDGLDIDPFVDTLLNGPYNAAADMNQDGAVNGLDVGPFVAAVIGGSSVVQAVAASPDQEVVDAGPAPLATAPATPVIAPMSVSVDTASTDRPARFVQQSHLPADSDRSLRVRHEAVQRVFAERDQARTVRQTHRARTDRADRPSRARQAAVANWQTAVDGAFGDDGDWLR